MPSWFPHRNRFARRLCQAVLLALLACAPQSGASAVERPFIADTFFYWYTWDYDQEMGGWIGGVYNTPLEGYYDSRTFRDNYRSLRTASEWGITHHFMDYWAPTWKADTGEMREAVVMRAAERLRREGYNIWMSYYQDGENFAMRNFARNVTEKRDVHQWLRDFSRSPVWPKVGGKPYQLVYSRNGAPELTPDTPGFQAFLKSYYGSIARLNREWGTSFRSFSEIEHDLGATGWHRAMAVRYQYRLWEKDWNRLQEAVRKEFGHPGVAISFDVGYLPFANLSYARFARLFGGPHSYAGIFNVPHDQDAQRFIQAAVARRYGTLFLDHFKNYYHDWEIRIPGTAYLPDPYNFDRFWVGDLMRYNQGILHLSWNEWWEGSNLEPCYEFGKTYCEKNLFYSTLMQECFPSIQAFGKGARVGLVLNDWLVESGCENQGEVLAALQALRRSMVPFDIIPDEFVTAKELSRFQVIVAPSGAAGFGRNGREERIADVLLGWVRGAPGRKLIVSGTPALRAALGVKPALPAGGSAARPGPDMNVFVDVGVPSDERFLRGGTWCEDWGKLGAENFGASTQSLTVRWTPGVGKRIRFTFPASPGRDHILRLRGRPFLPNRARVLVEEAPVAEVAFSGDFRIYEVRVPKRFIGSRKVVHVALVYPKAIVPQKEDPEHFPNEPRACNFALDWAQWSTANIGLSRQQRYTLPRERVRWLAPGVEVPAAHSEYQPLALPAGAVVLSRYTAAGVPRDISLNAGRGQVLLVNGLLSDADAPAYWDRVLGGWAKLRPGSLVSGPDVIGSRLSSGDTEILLAYNYGVQPAPVSIRSVPGLVGPKARTRVLPVASVRVLARDGRQWQQLPYTVREGEAQFRDRVRYYAVYEVARSAVRVDWPDPVFQPGETRAVPVRLTNLTAEPVQGRLSLQGYVPTLTAKPVSFALPPHGRQMVALMVRSDPRAEWGRRTVVIRVDAAGRRCSLWRPLTLERNPDLRLAATFPEAGQCVLTLRNAASPYIGTAPATGVQLRVGERTLDFGTLKAGESRSLSVTGLAPSSGDAAFVDLPARIRYASRSLQREIRTTLRVPVVPQAAPRLADAEAVYRVYNPADRPVDAQIVCLGPVPADAAHVREAGGHVVPSQVSGGKLYALVSLPPRSARLLYRCPGPAPAALSDLRVETEGLGSGAGRATIRNSRLALTIGEANGGVVTSLVSAATGLDYGLASFGATEGVFGKPHPVNPVISSTDYIRDKRRRMAEPAQIAVEAEGPLFAAVRVSARLGGRQVSTRYRLAAHAPEFTVERSVTPAAPRAGEELVVLDVPLRRNNLGKIFPNFTGVVTPEPQPHFGWRESAHVPPYASVMDGTGFRESLSFVVHARQGVGRFRQGIWPAQRPKPGPAEIAQLEYLAEPGAKQAALALTVMIHEGHQRVARRRLEEPAPYALAIPDPRWEGAAAAVSAPDDWHLPFHHGRVRVAVSGAVKPGEWLAVRLPGGMPASADYRLVRVEGDRARVLPVRVNPTLGVVGWLASGDEPGSRYFLYFDERAGGADLLPPKATEPPGKELRDPSFEEASGAWLFDGADRVQAPGASGSWAVRLRCREKGVPSLASNASMELQPNSVYRLTFRAKAENGPAEVRTNFYAGSPYDFPQRGIAVTADDWHTYTTELTTGVFPVGVQLALRLWILNPGQTALVDDIRLEPLGARPDALPGAQIDLGPVERSGNGSTG